MSTMRGMRAKAQEIFKRSGAGFFKQVGLPPGAQSNASHQKLLSNRQHHGSRKGNK